MQAWLARMLEAGAQCAVIETTSHALVQERVRACEFDVAAFTNVGHDHLDYHASWEEYLEAKARLIDLTANAADKGIEKTAVLNRDDPSYEPLSRRSISRRWSYGMKSGADIHPLDLSITGSGSQFRMKTPMGETEVTLNVPASSTSTTRCAPPASASRSGVPLEDSRPRARRLRRCPRPAGACRPGPALPGLHRLRALGGRARERARRAAPVHAQAG